jgi:hypothetical protein
MIEPLNYEITDAALETAIADKLLKTKDWFAIKGLINKHVPPRKPDQRPWLGFS